HPHAIGCHGVISAGATTGPGWLNKPEITPPPNSNHSPDGTYVLADHLRIAAYNPSGPPLDSPGDLLDVAPLPNLGKDGVGGSIPLHGTSVSRSLIDMALVDEKRGNAWLTNDYSFTIIVRVLG
ncbi:MAG: hypothetical protein ACM3Q0_07070, partial [Bacteroidota bacterium]